MCILLMICIIGGAFLIGGLLFSGSVSTILQLFVASKSGSLRVSQAPNLHLVIQYLLIKQCLYQWTGDSHRLKQQLGLIKILLIIEATLRVGTTYFVYKNANGNSCLTVYVKYPSKCQV